MNEPKWEDRLWALPAVGRDESLGQLLVALRFETIAYAPARGPGPKYDQAIGADALFAHGVHERGTLGLFADPVRRIVYAGSANEISAVYRLASLERVETILTDGRRYVIWALGECAGRFLLHVGPEGEPEEESEDLTLSALRRLRPQPVLPPR